VSYKNCFTDCIINNLKELAKTVFLNQITLILHMSSIVTRLIIMEVDKIENNYNVRKSTLGTLLYSINLKSLKCENSCSQKCRVNQLKLKKKSLYIYIYIMYF